LLKFLYPFFFDAPNIRLMHLKIVLKIQFWIKHLSINGTSVGLWKRSSPGVNKLLKLIFMVHFFFSELPANTIPQHLNRQPVNRNDSNNLTVIYAYILYLVQDYEVHSSIRDMIYT
jgi:hypothetical protein